MGLTGVREAAEKEAGAGSPVLDGEDKRTVYANFDWFGFFDDGTPRREMDGGGSRGSDKSRT